MPISIVVHGGAGTVSPEYYELGQQGCKDAVQAGWKVLQGGGSALDAVEIAAQMLEDNPVFNAGTGACLSANGHIELDAGIMDGRNLLSGAVASVELIKNPISLARKVLHSPHVLLVGRGAEQFARESGIDRCLFEDLLTERRYKRWREYVTSSGISENEPRIIRRELRSISAIEEEEHGTIGAVAIDSSGALAAATSTGGIYNKYPGRVGDSPLIGCGFYADESAAVSCTGYGEDFVRLMIARKASEFVASGKTAHEAAKASIAYLESRATGKGGLIVVDFSGNLGFAWNTDNMTHAYMTEGMENPQSGL